MTNLNSTFRYPVGDWRRDMSGGTGRTPIDGQRWPIGVISGGGGRTVITVRKPCALTCTV